MEKDINSLKLAYVGDAIYSFLVRDYIIKNYQNNYKINDIHKIVSNIVCAKSQSEIIDFLINNNLLTEKEIEIYKESRNKHPHSKSKNSSIVEYRKATGFEAVIAYIYYNDEKRLKELFDIIKQNFDKYLL